MLIDFEDIKHKLNSSKWYGTQAWYEILDIIGDCDNKSRLKGKWLMENDGYTDLFKCSECGEEWAMWFDDRKPQEQGYNFCPNCGADMRGEE